MFTAFVHLGAAVASLLLEDEAEAISHDFFALLRRWGIFGWRWRRGFMRSKGVSQGMERDNERKVTKCRRSSCYFHERRSLEPGEWMHLQHIPQSSEN